MNSKFARINFQLTQTDRLASLLPKFQQYLHDAALDGLADEFEIFYFESDALIGVSVRYDGDDAMSLLEAGSVLGYCLRRFEEYEGDIEIEHTWLSLHDSDEQLEDSVLPYPK